MDSTAPAMHYVCTREEAQELIRPYGRFWVSNCGCRESRGTCGRSRIDVCLIFNEGDQGSGSAKKEITPAEVEEILTEAQVKHLVSRPFRNEARTATDGICFCCDDCCGYFLNPEEPCDRGKLSELTERDQCTDCGVCVDVCYFGARKMEGEKLLILREKCHGCGICRDVCPEDCIEMVMRG